MPTSVLNFDSEGEYSFNYASYEREDVISRIMTSNKTSSQQFILSSSSTLQPERNTREPSKPSRWRMLVIMLSCLYLNYLTFGMAACLGVVYVALIEDLQCLRSEAALVQSLYLGLSLGGTILFSRPLTKYDTGYFVMVANTICCTAFALCMAANNIWVVLVLVGIIGGLSVSVSCLSAAIVVNWTFGENRRVALSVLTLGSALAQTTLPFLTNFLIDQYGWRGCLLILGGLFLNSAVFGFVIHLSKDYFHKPTPNNISKKSPAIFTMIKDVAFLIFLSTMFIFPGLGPVEQWFIVDLSVLKGYTSQEGTVLLSLNGVAGIFARVFSALYIKFYPKRRSEHVLCFAFLLWGLAHYLIVTVPYYWAMFMVMLLRGFASSIVVAFIPALQIALRGPDDYPIVAAMTFFVNGVGEILGGFLGGYSADVTGSYNLIFYIAAGAFVYEALSVELISSILKKRDRKEISQTYEKLPD
ncbi:monocarboxylate transporter 2-like [Mya arenaria]|uniref:monocarboxylate transporter 2-like n=1 Tax=Mya arenaria TaxID=6604 RepID=UPI0022DEAF36|nr:monocarboxylate transporter 2-like [Mya arenaria]